MGNDKEKCGTYYCKSCRNFTFHDNQGRCENTPYFMRGEINDLNKQ